MLVIACDHAGYDLKKAVIDYLENKGIKYKDIGTDSGIPVDYPNKAKEAAQMIVSGECDRGILICGTGIGMSIAANKVKGIRAAVCGDYFSAKATRQHNNANILCLGERVTGDGLAIELVNVFLNTEFEGGRHANRVNLIAQIEEN